MSENDHAVDALRYLLGGGAPMVRQHSGGRVSWRNNLEEEESPEDQISEPHSSNTLCAGPVTPIRESSVIGDSFSVGGSLLSREPAVMEGDALRPEDGHHVESMDYPKHRINLLDNRGFSKTVSVETKEYPKYCVFTPSGKVIVIDKLPEEGSPGEQYFESVLGGLNFCEASIEVPSTPKKRILET